MPVSPDMALELSKGLLDLYTQAEETMLFKVARRIERGIDQPGWAEIKLAEVQRLRREVQDEIATLRSAGADEIDEAIRTAYNRGVASAGTDLKRFRNTPDAIAFGVVDRRAVLLLVREALEGVESTHLRILRSTIDAYRSIIAEAAGQLRAGVLTRREGAQLALNRFADRGISGFIDTAGRAWNLPSYAEMSLRTASGHAAVQGHIDRLSEVGHDLTMVSDAPQECAACRPWEGQVLSITGRSARYPTVDDARSAGLFHGACRHVLTIYVPNVTRRPTQTADPIGSANREHQRYLERGVRGWKKRGVVAMDDSARAAARSKVREWNARLTEHIKANDLKRLSYRTSLGAR